MRESYCAELLEHVIHARDGRRGIHRLLPLPMRVELLAKLANLRGFCSALIEGRRAGRVTCSSAGARVLASAWRRRSNAPANHRCGRAVRCARPPPVALGLSPQCMECAKYPSPRTWRGGVCAARAMSGRGRTIASASMCTRCFSTKVLVASLLRAMVYVRDATGALAFHALGPLPALYGVRQIPLSTNVERGSACSSRIGRERQE